MHKIFSIGFARNKIIFIGAISCQLAFPSLAQDLSPAPAKGIGPAPLNSKQHQILNIALSAETRQTLAQAMNSVSTADMAHPAQTTK